jgi:Ca2+-binding EF-hand superfamily protein
LVQGALKIHRITVSAKMAEEAGNNNNNQRRIREMGRGESGDLRRAARDQWNVEELSIDLIFDQYDADKSGQLEANELKKLLKDYNGGTAADDKEFAWLMKVADKDSDAKISREELHYAMKAWHGYTHLTANFSQLFDKYDADKSNDLDAGELQKLLTELNEGTDVPLSDAEEVLKSADVMGDGKIGRYELLGAVGLWYVAVGREPTPEMLVALTSLDSTVKEQKKTTGGELIFSTFIAILCVVQGNRYMGRDCAVPLARMLIVSGSVSACAVIIKTLLYILMYTKALKQLAVCLMLLGGIAALASLAVNITGIVFVIRAHGDCDNDLWMMSFCLFVLQIIITWVLMFCAICCAVALLSVVKAHESERQATNAPTTTTSPAPASSGETAPLVNNT